MPTPLPTSGQLQIPVPSGEDIYDALMADIEPELLTVSIPLLEEKYKNETGQEKQARFQRYQEAYKKYDEAFAQWLHNFSQEVGKLRREALHSAEAQSQAQENEELSQLELQFNQ